MTIQLRFVLVKVLRRPGFPEVAARMRAHSATLTTAGAAAQVRMLFAL